MPSARRFAILAEGVFSALRSKTADACIRFAAEQVVAVIDSTRAGETANTVLGFGGDIPVVASLDAALAYRPAPTELLIGISPVGGRFDEAWRPVIVRAMRHRLGIWSGLHHFLSDDPDIAREAAAAGVAIHDLRKPPADLDVGRGRVRDVDATIVLTVGTDSNIGKMTASLRLRDALRARGIRAAFGATGQTGILIEGTGIAVDAVVADFIAGAAERVVLNAARNAEVVLVEGQGSIIHPSYSGVTLGLMHGAIPHAMILCTQPTRTALNHQPWVKIPPLPSLIRMHEALAEPLRPARVVGVALNTFDLSEDDARVAVDRASADTRLPATDPVRFDASPLAEAIASVHRARRARSSPPALG